jgi:hypothetical protein
VTGTDAEIEEKEELRITQTTRNAAGDVGTGERRYLLAPGASKADANAL